VPGNYVLLFILMMGSRQSKLLEASIRTMQKLFSYNYIHEHEELSTNLLKEEFKEYLLVDPATLKNKSVSEIYLETLMAIQERDEAIILLIIKNLSLVVRLFQHCLSSEIIKGVFYYLTDMLMNKPTNIDKTIKSTIIQIVRHILENLREIDFNILVDNDAWSLKKVCRDTLTGVVDQIVIKQAVT
jgi:transcription termination factor NusB